MTVSVQKALDKLCNDEIFNDELYFSGGTALAYYLKHRISEDIDIISSKILEYKKILPSITKLGAIKVQDENVIALRMAGLFPDEYMIKFIIDDVKLEFFQGNRSIQKEIIKDATFSNYENSNLKILDVKSVAKLKIVALIMRNKSRDLFDFGSILEHNVLNSDELISLFSKVDKKFTSLDDIIDFIGKKEEPKEDEAVYLTESNRVNLSFEEIKQQVIKNLKF